MERGWLWCQRRPALATLWAALALALVGVTVMSLAFARFAQRRAQEAVASSRRLAEEKLIGERKLYVAEMNLATRAWQDGEMDLVSHWLHDMTPGPTNRQDLRGFEWHYLNHLRHLDLLTLNAEGPEEHRQRGSGEIAISKDGRYLAWPPILGNDETVNIYELRLVKVVQVLRGSKPLSSETLRGGIVYPRSLSFSADGRFLAMGGYGFVLVWESSTGRVARTFTGHTASVGCVRFSPDSRWIASAAWNPAN